MKKSIKIPILFMDEKQQALEEMEIRIPINEHDTREVIFYNIDSISPYIEDGVLYSSVNSGGDSFISPIEPNKLDSILENKLRTNNQWQT